MRPDHRKISIWAVPVILFLALSSPAYGNETYVSQEIIAAPWGSETGQFGLIEEAEGVGPQSLCLDPEGNIYILDLVNRRVQVFTPQGDYLRQIPFQILAHDLCLSQKGDLYLLAPYDGLGEQLDLDGKPLARWSISPRIQLIDGIRAAGDLVVVRTAAQVEHLVADAKGLLSPDDQLKTTEYGMGGPDPAKRYRTRWINDHLGTLQVLDPNGQTLREVSVTTRRRLGSLVFMGADSQGNVYLRAETFGAQGDVIQKVLKHDPEGNLRAEFEVSMNGFTYLYRNLRVHHNGDLYQLHTEPLGVKVLRWRAVSQHKEDPR